MTWWGERELVAYREGEVEMASLGTFCVNMAGRAAPTPLLACLPPSSSSRNGPRDSHLGGGPPLPPSARSWLLPCAGVCVYGWKLGSLLATCARGRDFRDGGLFQYRRYAWRDLGRRGLFRIVTKGSAPRYKAANHGGANVRRRT